MRYRPCIIACLFVLAGGGAAAGQSVLHVSSDSRDAIVVADSTVLGAVRESPFGLSPGTYVVRLMSDDAREWEEHTPSVKVSLEDGESATVHLDFDFRIRVESVPFGAEVSRVGSDASYGRTPVSVFLASGDSLDVNVSKSGFQSARVTLHAAERFQRELVRLIPEDAVDAGDHAISWEPPSRRNEWIDYAAAGFAVAAGITAVHFKFKADDLFDEYERTGDPALRPQFRRYDIYSGVALGAMQLGVGVVGIRILLR